MSQTKQPIIAKQTNKSETRQPAQMQQAPELLPIWGQPKVAMRRALNEPRSLTLARVAYLQRVVGNQALGQLVSSKTLRPTEMKSLQNSSIKNHKPSISSLEQSRSLQTKPGQEEQSWVEDAGEWALGAIGGEFIDEQSFGQIGTDFVLSIIPGVDQVADARDLSAQIYRLGFKGEHNNWQRWLSLVFTLIGLFPEVGSVIKSLSKAMMRGASKVFEHIGDILRLARRFLPEGITDAWRLQRYIRENWSRFANFAVGTWNSLLTHGQALVNMIPRLFGKIRAVALAKLSNLWRLSPGWLSRAIERARSMLDDALERIRARFRQSQNGVEEIGERTGRIEQATVEAEQRVASPGHVTGDSKRQTPSDGRNTGISSRAKRRRDIARPDLPKGNKAPRLPIQPGRFSTIDYTLRSDLVSEQERIIRQFRQGELTFKQAGDQYQNLIAVDLHADDVQEMFRRPRRRMDIGTEHEVTIEGAIGSLGTEKLDQLWLDLVDNKRVILTVPKLSSKAQDQLRRLGALAESKIGAEVYILVRETMK